MRKALRLGSICVVAIFAASPALSETISLDASLTPGAEIPANNSEAKGAGHFTYDTETNQLTYFVRYQNLSGDVTAADIHGPAGSNDTAPKVVHFYAPESPISGNATLSDSQAADLINGRYYVEVNTDAHPTGEIRGQIQK
jgi:hypothetical protein